MPVGGCAAAGAAGTTDEAGCKCPTRDEGIVPAVPSEIRLAITGAADVGVPAETEPAAAVTITGTLLHVEFHRPPPKAPLHKALGVFLC
jgi:hypothetical protein